MQVEGGVTVDHLLKDIGISAFTDASHKMSFFSIRAQKGRDDEHASMPEGNNRGMRAIDSLIKMLNAGNVYAARFDDQSHDPVGKKSEQSVFKRAH